MAAEQVNQILQALQLYGQVRQQRAQQSLEQQRIQDERTARQQEIDFRHEQLEQQKAQFDANLELQQKAADLQHTTAKAQIADIINRGGTIPGDVVQANYPPIAGTAGAFQGVGPMPDVTQQPTTLRHTINDENGNPIMTMDLAPPEAYARQQANLERITLAPKEELEEKKQAAKEAADLARESELERIRVAGETERDIARTRAAAAERMQIQQMIIDAENKRKEMDNATTLRKGMIDATGGMSELYPDMFKGGGPNAANGSIVKLNPDGSAVVNSSNFPTNINNSLNSIYNGRDSLERIEKTNPKLKQMIATTAGMSNIGSLTDEEVKGLHDLQLEIPALQTLQDLHNIKINSPLLGVNVPFFNSEFNTKEKELGTNVGHIAISQTGAKRQNEADLQRFHTGLMPSRDLMQRSTTEQDKLNNYIEKLKSDARSYVQGLPPDQQNVVLHNYGMLDLDKYKVGKGAAPAQVGPQTPKQPIINIPQLLQQPSRGLPNIGVPYVPPTNLPSLPPSKMWVKRKSDGQTVNIPKDEWDSRKYERVQ